MVLGIFSLEYVPQEDKDKETIKQRQRGITLLNLLRGAERVWPPRNEAQPNREGVAAGGATYHSNNKYKNFIKQILEQI